VITGQADRLHLENYSVEKTYASNIEKPKAYLVPKNTKGDFISSIIRGQAFKMGPGQYKLNNENTFNIESRNIHFYNGTAKKVSVFDETAKRQAWVPGANVYKPNNSPKILGNTKT
jgi:hypothetical protein